MRKRGFVMLDPFLMTICGDKAAQLCMRTSAIYNWACKHNISWNDIVCADDDILIAVLNDCTLKEAKTMLANS